MQTPPPASHTWTEFAGYGLATLTAALAGLYTAWKNRKRPEQDNEESAARTDLAIAQTTQTVAQTLQSVSTQLQEANATIADLMLKQDAKNKREELLVNQLRHAKAMFERAGIIWDEKA